jgi:hypothetical protein
VLTYIVIIVVVIAVLYGSFRALGGGAEPVSAEDYRGMLARIGSAAAEAEPALDTIPAAGSAAEVAAALRKRLSAAREQLIQVAWNQDGADRDRLDSARALLAAGLDDLLWACRIIESEGYRDNPGLQDAVTALRDHARRCLEASDQAL